jgi:hypothetical protein
MNLDQLNEELDKIFQLNEYEVYTDENGVTRDDEGNVMYTGQSQGLRNRWPTKSLQGSPYDKAVAYGKKMGVSSSDVKRYWDKAKGKEPAVYSMIKNKAKKQGRG